MIPFVQLNSEELARVNAKLAELSQKTGRLWTCEVTKDPASQGKKTEAGGEVHYLEIAIDGRVLKPVVMLGDDDRADRICSELDRAYESKAEFH